MFHSLLCITQTQSRTNDTHVEADTIVQVLIKKWLGGQGMCIRKRRKTTNEKPKGGACLAWVENTKRYSICGFTPQTIHGHLSHNKRYVRHMSSRL